MRGNSERKEIGKEKEKKRRKGGECKCKCERNEI
jgi:hypothetical protein